MTTTPPETQPTSTGPKETTDKVTILAGLPYTFADPQCCMRYSAELWQDERDQVFVTFTHEVDCEIWRYLP